MPHSWFVLARLFLRVDNVLFRIYDVRLYHAFGEGVVIRDISGMEASYEDVKAVRPDSPLSIRNPC
jgi:type 2A phosphatase activator TIP41